MFKRKIKRMPRRRDVLQGRDVSYTEEFPCVASSNTKQKLDRKDIGKGRSIFSLSGGKGQKRKKCFKLIPNST